MVNKHKKMCSNKLFLAQLSGKIIVIIIIITTSNSFSYFPLSLHLPPIITPYLHFCYSHEKEKKCKRFVHTHCFHLISSLLLSSRLNSRFLSLFLIVQEEVRLPSNCWLPSWNHGWTAFCRNQDRETSPSDIRENSN